jgi:hypothetical protein
MGDLEAAADQLRDAVANAYTNNLTKDEVIATVTESFEELHNETETE